MGKINRMSHLHKHRIFALTFFTIFLMALSTVVPSFAAPARYFLASITPTSITAGATTTFTVTITNNGPHKDQVQQLTESANLESVQIAVPSGFSGVSTVSLTTSNPKHWTALISSSAISLNSGGNPNQVPQGGSITYVFTAKATIGQLYTWTVQAWDGNPAGTGTAFSISGSQPTVAVNNLLVTPEYAFGALVALGACFGGFVVFKKRSSLPHFRWL